MVRLRHVVRLAPVPRDWFDEALRAGWDAAGSLRADGGRILLPDGRALPGLRLVTGAHLRPGAVYEVVDRVDRAEGAADGAPRTTEVTLGAWDRATRVRLAAVVAPAAGAKAADGASADGEVRAEAELRSVAAPREAAVRLDLPGVRGSGRVALDAWWAAAAGQGGAALRGAAAPLRGTVTHRFARAVVDAVPRPGPDGAWEVRVTVAVRGRGPLRPVLWAALLAGRGRLRSALVPALDRAAGRWNLVVPVLVEQPPGELLDRVVRPG